MSSPNPMSASDLEQYFTRYATFERRAADLHPANRNAILSVLRAHRITHVVVTFDGYGDSGQIEAVESWRGEAEAELPAITVEILQLLFESSEPEMIAQPLPDAIETLAYHYLGQAHCGWENNDGAYGEFVFDVAGGTITLDYNERFTDSTNYSHEF